MFDLDRFIADCRAAVRAGPDPQIRAGGRGARRLRPGRRPRRCRRAQARRSRKLYHAPDLTILNVVWGPHMTIMPHNHLMWAVIGIYTGREDNIFWRRMPARRTGRSRRPGPSRSGASDVEPLGPRHHPHGDQPAAAVDRRDPRLWRRFLRSAAANGTPRPCANAATITRCTAACSRKQTRRNDRASPSSRDCSLTSRGRRCGRGLTGQVGGAERASPRGNRNLAVALRALLGGGIGRGVRAPQPRHHRVHRQHDKEIDRRRYQQERNNGIDKVANQELAAVDREFDRRKIRCPDDSRDQRRQQIFHECGNDGAEGDPHDDRDGKIKDVTAQNELLEPLQHG